jgi:hypothetical protein
MTLHQLGPFVPIATLPLLSALAIWSAWRIRAVYRKRGRRVVERLLTSRGETLVAIKEVRLSALSATAGLSAAVIFEVRARTAEGDERTYQWAYAPRGVFPWQTEGVQRLAHGIWIAA